jgi:hypothetical protein
MFWRDHSPPHFHAKYGDEEVTVEITTGVVNGSISNRALKMIQEWRELHIDELMQEWALAETRKALFSIKGLD